MGTFKIPPGYTDESSREVFSSIDPVPGKKTLDLPS
jgi:hypothetical protein